MKLTATVMGQRRKSDLPMHMDYREFEPYAVADVLVDGEAGLIASSLRALADSIDPPQDFRAVLVSGSESAPPG